MLHQLMDPRGGYFENYRCADECQMLNTSTKTVCVTQLIDVLIIQLNIFKYIGVINKVPYFCGGGNSKVLRRKFRFGEKEWYRVVLNHEGEQSHCRS